jgi:hypothetical protein
MTKKEMLKEKPLGKLKALRQRITELEAIVAACNSDEKSNEFDDVQKYKAVFESTTDVVLVIDKKGKISDRGPTQLSRILWSRFNKECSVSASTTR